MDLVDYPKAIAEKAKEYLCMEKQLRIVKKELEELEWQISKPIMFDGSLKNQSQRDYARKEALSTNALYQETLVKLEKLQYEAGECRIELQFLRERCSVLKIAQLARLEFLSRVEVPNDIRVHLSGLALQGLFSSYAQNSVDPQTSVKQIFIFVETLLSQLNQEGADNHLWSSNVCTPEFYPDETAEIESEFEDEGD